MIAKEIRLTVCTYEMAQELSEEAKRQGRNVHIHIGLDTGMSRIGFADRQESVARSKRSKSFRMSRLRECSLILRERMKQTEVRLWIS